MLNSKQRAYLRSLANPLETVLMIGKGGMSEEIITQADGALTTRELIKCKVLVETCPISPKEAAQEVSTATNSEVVQVIGSKFILYRKNEKEPKIVLPKEKKSRY